jgi:hypothetical protein
VTIYLYVEYGAERRQDSTLSNGVNKGSIHGSVAIASIYVQKTINRTGALAQGDFETGPEDLGRLHISDLSEITAIVSMELLRRYLVGFFHDCLRS